MKFQSTKDESDHLAEINIVPMVDIMLVLLIIFMVTAPMLQEGLDINLPEVSAGSVEASSEDFVLSIDDQGQMYINENAKEKFSINSIEEKLMTAFKDKKEKELYLKADQSIKYGFVVQVMAACRRAGVEKVGMITAQPDEEIKEFQKSEDL
jgi:biopolymer transport protein TolR